MARAFRLLKWLCFAGLLAAVGVPVFHFVRHRPRCTITVVGDVPHLSADGSRLVTLNPRSNTVWLRGPLQIWDTNSGRVEADLFGDVGVDWLETSSDGQTLAASLTDGTVHLVDLPQGEGWRLAGIQREGAMLFSPNGRWLWVNMRDEEPSCLVDVPARKVALRLRGFMGFSNDGKLAFARVDSDVDLRDAQSKTEVWDVESGVKSATLATGLGRVGATSRGLLVFRTGILKTRGPGKGFRETGVDLWDLATFTHRWSWRHPAADKLQLVFSPDGKTLARWHRDQPADSELALVDAATGRPRWSTVVKRMYAGGFSSDGALWFVWQTSGTGTLTVFDAATGDVLWEKRGQPMAPRFIGVNRLLYDGGNIAPALLDGATGQVIGALPLHTIRADNPDAGSAIAELTVTPDGRHFAYSGWTRDDEQSAWRQWLEKWRLRLFGDHSRAVAVIDSATGTELCRVVGVGSRGHLLSDDASTLVTVDGIGGDEQHTVRVWDVSAAKAWLWSLTVAAAVGSVILALRWAWRRRTNIVARPSET